MATYGLVSPDSDTIILEHPTQISGLSSPSHKQSPVERHDSRIYLRDVNALTQQSRPTGAMSSKTLSSSIDHRPTTNEKESIATKVNVARSPAPSDLRHSLPYASWKPSFLMFGLLLCGIVLVVGHHLVYQYLDGEPVSSYSQTWIIRVATGAALIIKTCWSLAVGIALQQTLWFTFRQDFVKMGSIDNLLTIDSNLLSFLSFDTLKAAPIGIGLAVIIWLLPVLTVITPGTLSVVVDNDHYTHSMPCRAPTFGAGGFEGASIYRANDSTTQYFVFPGPQTSEVAGKVLYGGAIVPFVSPCGPNCTYNINFNGPGFECKDSPNYVITPYGINGSHILNESAVADPSNTTWITPGSPGFTNTDHLPYYTAVVGSDFDHVTLWIQYFNNDSAHHVPDTFTYDPDYLYDGKGSPGDGLGPLTYSQTNETWQTLSCTLQNTTYAVNVTFQNGDLTTNTTKVVSTPLGTGDPFSGRPLPPDDGEMPQYLGLATIFLHALNGSVIGSVPPAKGVDQQYITPVIPITDTEITYTGIASLSQYIEMIPADPSVNSTSYNFTHYDWRVEKPFLTALPELFTNMTLSSLSISRKLMQTTCFSSLTQNVYRYEPRFLLLAYLLGLLATCCCIAFGVFALHANGIASSSSFSQIVRSTGNPALHRTLDGGSRVDALQQKVMYGALLRGEENARSGAEPSLERSALPTFGLQGQVVKLRKNTTAV